MYALNSIGDLRQSPAEAGSAAIPIQQQQRMSLAGMALSPQRLPPKPTEEWHSCGSDSGKRSVSEPRQRVKRPAAAHADAVYLGSLPGGAAAAERIGPGRGLRGRRPAGASPLVVGSPGRNLAGQVGRPYTADQLRSASINGLSESFSQAVGRFGLFAAASSPSDIVSPGSLYGSSPG
jgi:hypothetical protein